MNNMRYIILCSLILIFGALLANAQLGKGDIIFKVNKKIGDVLFPHKVHVVFKHINCEYCHNILLKPYINEAKEKSKAISEVIDKLFCNNCHDGQKAFSTDNELSCKRCHSIVEKDNKNGKNYHGKKLSD